MRILLLSQRHNIQGPLPKIVPVLVAALRRLGAHVELEGWGRISEVESIWKKVSGRIRDLIRIRVRLTRQSFDILVVMTSHDWRTLSRDLPLLLVTRGLVRRVVLQMHGSEPALLLGSGHRLFKAASSALVGLCNAIMVLSSEEQRQWQAFYPAGRFYVVENPFEAHERKPRAYGLPRNDGKEPILLFVGRLIAAKGIFDLLNAMKSVLEMLSCRLLIVGDGDQAEEVKRQVRKLGLEEHVTVAGYLKGSELMSAYDSADVFVLPSYWNEGFPTVLAEAMNAGLPIITTRIRGAADRLEQNVNALFVPQRDIEALANAVIYLLKNCDLRERMSQANLEKLKEFAPDIVGSRYLQILETVFSKP